MATKYKHSYFIIMKVKGKAVPALTEHNAMKAYGGNGGIAPRII
jgi:hypothetical protein